MLKKATGIAAMLAILVSGSTNAGNSWHWGKVSKIQTLDSDGSFLLYTDNSEINQTCAYDRVEFRVTDMGIDRTKAALSMAMTAMVSGVEYGVVVDLPSSGEICYASPTSTQGAGIRN